MPEISLRKDLNYSSPFYHYLANFDENKLYYKVHVPPLFHPADILQNQVKDIYDAIVSLQQKLNTDDFPITETKNLFQAADKLADVCFEIIRAFINPNNANNNENDHYKWLANNKSRLGKDFLSSISSHRDFIADINNKTKHNTTKILKVNLTNEDLGITTKGFFVGTIIKDERIGPDPKIHKHWNNQRTGFSYNYIIRRIVGQTFLYEYNLKKILEKNFGIVTDYHNMQDDLHKKLFDIGINISNAFFPNEYCMPTGIFKQCERALIIEFPKTVEKRIQYTNVITDMDVNSRTHKCDGYIPYFGNKIDY